MRHLKKHNSQLGRSALLLAGITLMGALLVVFALMAVQRRPTPPAPVSHFVEVSPKNQAAAELRTVVIAKGGQALPHMSETEGLLMTSLVSGQLPTGAAQAIVRTDSNCQPDQDGISHCLNELAIGSTTMVVRHHHRMSEISCLTPGETVNILSLEQYQKL
jgi:hypothetical protein